LALIDSITITGYADSTGRKKQNLKLSQKRAKTVATYLKHLLGDSIPIQYHAKGEQNTLKNPKINPKRVVIVLRTPEKLTSNDPSFDRFEMDTATIECYQENEQFIANCLKTNYKKGKTHYTELAVEPHLIQESAKYYTYSSNARAFKLIKWHLDSQGHWWWKRPTYVAQVKTVDFTTYGIFTKVVEKTDTSACYLCAQSVLSSWHPTEIIGVEIPVMQDLQLRKQPFDGSYLVIVPKHTIDLERSYFAANDPSARMDWFVKAGKKNSPFYFATVPTIVIDTNVHWSIYGYQFHCAKGKENSDQMYSVLVQNRKRTSIAETSKLSPFRFGLEGMWSNYSHHLFTGAAYARYTLHHLEFKTTVGCDQSKSFLSAFNLNYYLWSYSCFRERFISGTNHPPIEAFLRTINLYAGSNIQWHAGTTTALFQSIHVGLDFRNNPISAGFDRMYTTVGYRHQYLGGQSGLLCTIGVQFCF
jgi:hypothetical protein